LLHAAGAGRYEAVQWFLQHGMPKAALEEALTAAVLGRHDDVMNLLLESGAGIDA
jgi:hypothetical protein